MPAPLSAARAALVAVTGALVVAAAPSAAGASSCGDAVLRDWSDGSIDRTYPRRCYQQALQDMPEDLRIYSSAEDDVRRALLNAKPARPASAAPRRPAEARGGAAARGRAATPRPRRALEAHERRAAPADAPRAGGDGLPLPLPLLLALAVVALWGAAGLASVAVAAVRRRAGGRDRAA